MRPETAKAVFTTTKQPQYEFTPIITSDGVKQMELELPRFKESNQNRTQKQKKN